MIEEFRRAWHGCAAEVQLDCVRGSAASVARWSLDRTQSILRYFSRAPLQVAEVGEHSPTPHEQSLQHIAACLAKGNRDLARAHAQWLVKPVAIERLLRALEPVSTGPAKLVKVA
ncbi:hypothetical protein E3U23_05035 [Erythrobacter litoralis]|uniref:hypothetical protein n=1 Tax=Erythrobacter litoralis TaxID=39960 RepID=UPI002434F9C4|nr:hypothetical protein [Erythrobacter litoralis]MDG6078557.1 hypothetical protein [Erythrobacter litoralis]